MEIRILVRQLLSLNFGPHHESVHGPANPRLLQHFALVHAGFCVSNVPEVPEPIFHGSRDEVRITHPILVCHSLSGLAQTTTFVVPIIEVVLVPSTFLRVPSREIVHWVPRNIKSPCVLRVEGCLAPGRGVVVRVPNAIWRLLVLGVRLLLLHVERGFAVGVQVGIRKGGRRYRWGDAHRLLWMFVHVESVKIKQMPCVRQHCSLMYESYLGYHSCNSFIGTNLPSCQGGSGATKHNRRCLPFPALTYTVHYLLRLSLPQPSEVATRRSLKMPQEQPP